ncbi:toxin-antitoxin system TumE family protein [Neorhizobium petrolearium]|uniref:toxin-antitoxin system TumE family protein n=1 Tax=Neorhizobium petrolearium TaxID=515361 RepID=UPI003F14BC78
MAPATLILDRKLFLENGAILQMKVWRLSAPSGERPHGLKYSLFYGRPGERIIGYDNEQGKGDHRHCRGREEGYRFTTLEQMILDFEEDVRREIGI